MSYPLYIVLGVLPSLIWLLFYLRKDAHPESKRMVLKIFLFGMLAALPAILLEMGIYDAIAVFNLPLNILPFLQIFIAVALVEEFIKYLVVSGKALKSSELDEPLDVMVYMIIAALGFAASENILILFSLGPAFALGETFSLTFYRFVGATFLHALVSGFLGYFIALSFCKEENKGKILVFGFASAVFLHGLYNFSIMRIEGWLSWIIPAVLLVSLAFFVAFGFKKLKQLKGVCKI